MNKLKCLVLMAGLIGACGDDSSVSADASVDGAVEDLAAQMADLLAPDLAIEPDMEPACPSWRCTGSDCGQLIQMPGATNMAYGVEDGYYLSGGEASQYRHWIRKDVAMLVIYAACEVKRKFPDVPPLGLTDMSEKDGSIPGTSSNKPAHPDGTHTNGHDIDVAYYQTDGLNEPQIVCGDGSDNNYNGYPGKYNDGYFCTTEENIVNWEQQVYFFSKLFESDQARVFGIDEALVQSLATELTRQDKQGLIPETVIQAFNKKIAWGAAGGWQFHHHHIHMSFR